MRIVPCPGCGREVGSEALACPHCRVPVKALLGPGTVKMHPLLAVLLVLGGGMGVVVAALMAVGMMVGAGGGFAPDADAYAPAAGVEGPDPEWMRTPTLSAADSAVLREAIRGLRAMDELQARHMAEHGEHTTNLGKAGWRDPGSRHYEFVVSTIAHEHLCMDAVPRTGAARPVSMDGAAVMYAGLECRGQVISDSAGEDWLPVEER